MESEGRFKNEMRFANPGESEQVRHARKQKDKYKHQHGGSTSGEAKDLDQQTVNESRLDLEKQAEQYGINPAEFKDNADLSAAVEAKRIQLKNLLIAKGVEAGLDTAELESIGDIDELKKKVGEISKASNNARPTAASVGPHAASKKKIDMAEIDRLRAHAFILDVNVPVNATEAEIRDLILAAQSKLIEEAQALTPDDKLIPGLSAVSLFIYKSLAKPGQRFEEVSKLPQFTSALQELQRKENAYIEKWKPKGAVKDVASEKSNFYEYKGTKFKIVGPGKKEKEQDEGTKPVPLSEAQKEEIRRKLALDKKIKGEEREGKINQNKFPSRLGQDYAAFGIDPVEAQQYELRYGRQLTNKERQKQAAIERAKQKSEQKQADKETEPKIERKPLDKVEQHLLEHIDELLARIAAGESPEDLRGRMDILLRAAGYTNKDILLMSPAEWADELRNYSQLRRSQNLPEDVESYAKPEAEVAENLERKIEFKAYAADLTELVDRIARQQANDKFRLLYEKSGLIKHLWQHQMEDFYIAKFYDEARQTIEKNKNLMALLESRVTGKEGIISGDVDESFQVMDAVIEAYVKELGIKDREKGETLVNDRNLNEGLGEIFYLATKENWDRQKFNLQLTEVLQTIDKRKFSKDSVVRGEVFATDIWKHLQAYKDQIHGLIEKFGPENEQALRDHIYGLMNVDLQLGRKDSDIREHPKKLAFLEALQAKAQGTRIGGLLANPMAMGAISTVGSLAAKRGVRPLATATALFIAPTVAPVFVSLAVGTGIGAAYAYLRRSKEVKQDFSSERVQAALGRQAGGAKADRIRATMLQMVDAGERAQQLVSNPTAELVADTMARLQLEDNNENIQELFSASTQNASLNTRLIDMNRLRQALNSVSSNPEFGVDKLKQLVDERKQAIESELQDKEKAFDRLSRSQNAKAAVQGAVSGLVGGVISQEAIHYAKQALGYDAGDTIRTAVARRIFTGEWHKQFLGELSKQPGQKVFGLEEGMQASVHSPKGFEFLNPHDITGADGSIHHVADYAYGNQHIVNNIELDNHGVPTPESVKLLADQGFLVKVFHDHATISQAVSEKIAGGQLLHETAESLKQRFTDADWGVHKRIDWHHQGPQFSSWFGKVIEHPGKEQMLQLTRDSSGHVVVDAHKLLENLSANLDANNYDTFTNPDGSIDSKMKDVYEHLVAAANNGYLHEKIQAVILPDKGSALSASFTADSSGHITLPESISKIMTDLHDGKLPFTIELRLDDGHVLATASGGNEVFGQIAQKVVPQNIDVYKTYLIPPVYDEMEPMIPTAMARRYALETAVIPPKHEESKAASASARFSQAEVRLAKSAEISAPEFDAEIKPTTIGEDVVADIRLQKTHPPVDTEVQRILGDINMNKVELPSLDPTATDIEKLRHALASQSVTLEMMRNRVREQYEIFKVSHPENAAGEMIEFMRLLGFQGQDWVFDKGQPYILQIEGARERMRKLLTTPQKEVKELPAGREAKGLLDRDLVSRRYLAKIYEMTPSGRKAIHLPGRGKEVFHLPEKLSSDLFDFAGAKYMVERMSAQTDDFLQFENWLNRTRKSLGLMLGNKKEADKVMEFLMVVLGFDKKAKDWSVKSGKIKINSLYNVNLTYQALYKDHPEHLKNSLEEVTDYKANIKLEERRIKIARQEVKALQQ